MNAFKSSLRIIGQVVSLVFGRNFTRPVDVVAERNRYY